MLSVETIEKIIDDKKQDLIDDTISFINVKSVINRPIGVHKYGKDIAEFLNFFKKRCEEIGLFVVDYGCGIISASLYEGKIDLGIWLHGDTVPECDGWKFNPFNAVEYEGCIIGRGATDNKGQLATIFNLFKIFKSLDVKLGYNPAIFLGSNEESGKADICDFLESNEPPKMSFVPDGDFPVAFAGNGDLEFRMKSKDKLESCVIEAGQEQNPARANAYFKSFDLNQRLKFSTLIKEDGLFNLMVNSLPVHGATPIKNGSMITFLADDLLSVGQVSSKDKNLIEIIRLLSLDVYGEWLGFTKLNLISPISVQMKRIDNVDGFVELVMKIRYPVGITREEIANAIIARVEEKGFTVANISFGDQPFAKGKDDEVLNLLCKISSSVYGKTMHPYFEKGGTYAQRLPNAYIFGMSGNRPPKSFPKERGWAHGVDEAVSVERLLKAMKIYARTLIELSKKEVI